MLLCIPAVLVLASLWASPAAVWENFCQNRESLPDSWPPRQHAGTRVGYVKQTSLISTKPFRMTGSGHAHSDVAVSGEFLLTPNVWARPAQVLDRSRLRPDNPLMVRVQSGHVRIREVDW